MPETTEITQQAAVKKTMPHVPKFIRDFSKENSQEERNMFAQEIREKRAEYFTRKNVLGEQKKEIGGKKDTIQELKDQKDREREDLFETITELSDKWPMRTLRSMKLRKMRKELRDDDMEFMRLSRELGDLKREEDYVTQQLEIKGVNAELGEARELLDKFYESQKDAWNKTPYDLAEMQRILTPEHLSSLPMEDYVALLKRFPSYMVTHVTRQGLRDHWGHGFHTAGLGEYHNGFLDILKEGKISSVVGAAYKDGMKQEAVGKLFGLDRCKTKKEALDMLQKHMKNSGAGGSQDVGSVHTAIEWVADFYYGGESGNEIFFTFPSAFIGANYYTRGNLYDESTHDGSNDTWIWTEPDKGLPINAGITFIPEAAQVDPKTGSRYELDENLKPVVDTHRITGLKTLLGNADFIKALEHISEIRRSVPYGYQRNSELENQVEVMRDQFGIEDLPLLKGIAFGNTSTGSASALIFAANFELKEKDELEMGYYIKRGGIEAPIKSFLQELQLLYKLTPNPISSKEYWEEFFSKNPEMKPNKIAYYNGSPELAFSMWRGEKGLGNFPSLEHEKYAVTDKKKVEKGQAEFEALALNAIDAMFPPEAS